MSKEAKPIAVVYYHHRFGATEPGHIQDALDDRWPDYHVLVVPAREQDRAIELEVFYDKNFTDTNYEELKKWIEDSVLKPQTPPIHSPSPPTENKP